MAQALGDFLGGYLHQDWDLEYENHWIALEAFCREAPELAADLSGEIDALLGEYADTPRLRAALVALGGNYLSTGSDGTVRSWLAEVGRRAEKHLTRE